jgi:hypothetical protein
MASVPSLPFLAATVLVVRVLLPPATSGLLLGSEPGASLAAHGFTFPIGPNDPV